jgi:DNA-directed RNA polymerase specialized sigma subunit
MEHDVEKTRQVDRLARRAKSGDKRALEDLFRVLAPYFKTMGAAREFRAGMSVVDSGDYEQAANMSVLESIEKWAPESGVPFIAFALSRSGWAMAEEGENNVVTATTRTGAKRVRRAHKKLKDELDREPTIDELYEVLRYDSAGIDNQITRGTIQAAIDAFEPPRHLDYSDGTSTDSLRDSTQQSALQVFDTYLGEEDEPEIPALHDDLMRLRDSTLGKGRRLFDRYMDTDGDWEKLADEFGYSSPNAARYSLTEGLRKIDPSSKKASRRADEERVRKMVRKYPILLNRLAAKQRERFELSCEDFTVEEIATKYGVEHPSVGSSLRTAYESLRDVQVKMCNTCNVEKCEDEYHVRCKRKDGTDRLQSYCIPCKAEHDKKYAVKRRASASAQRQREKQRKAEMRVERELAEKSPATYRAWKTIIDRCSDPANSVYAKYGGAGVKVCERWHDFENFLADMGEKPGKQSLRRFEEKGDFEPKNCFWGTYNLGRPAGE